ncbi:MAG TPA: retropepsin-like aspartic protease [Phycisphaerae bacterium]|nr:retropepsin-like aspartic protease [Phycisphaerae bacterium]HRR83774.1 retropepsin-like aspartic protease [Phycisphaerae bacterium]
MMHGLKTWMPVLLAVGWIVVSSGALLAAEDTSSAGSKVNIRTSGGMRIVAVRRPASSPAINTQALAAPSSVVTAAEPMTAGTLSTPFPRPPLAGFSPLVAITTSDKREFDDLMWDHTVHHTYTGNALNAPANANFIIGIFDSGSVVDLVAEPWDWIVGLTGTRLTGNPFPIGGTGGTVDAIISKPVGYFANGLSAVDAASGLLDLTKVVGHGNTCLLVAPEIACGNGEGLTAVLGTGFVSFFNTIIRVDTPIRRGFGGDDVLSPSVQIQDQSIALPLYPRKMSMTFSSGGLPVTTASYYGLLDPWTWEVDIILPTLLGMGSGMIPLGGYFFGTIGAIEGEPGPTNPLQNMRVLVDTGAQSSIITPGMAANLNLDLYNPDFTVDICGIGGLTTDVPGFWVDYVKMNAAGGALEFSQAPFVVVDMASPDGGQFDGVLGMNFFWNRNVIFQPVPSGSSFLHISDPIPFAYGDLDRDLDVDQDDFEIFSACSSGPGIPFSAECTLVDADDDGDIDQTDFGFFQACLSGENVPADVNCKP